MIIDKDQIKKFLCARL